MPNAPSTPPPSDVCLLLRADAEQYWLNREVIPVLRELEAPETLAEEQVGVALAYLEAMWGEARIRARATEAARRALRCAADWGEDSLSAERSEDPLLGDAGADPRFADRGEHLLSGETGGDPLSAAAGRYHAAVRVLRELVAARVSTLVQPAQESDGAYESAQTLLADASAGGGGAPRAA